MLLGHHDVRNDLFDIGVRPRDLTIQGTYGSDVVNQFVDLDLVAGHDLDLSHKIMEVIFGEAAELFNLVAESSGDQLLIQFESQPVVGAYLGVLLKVVELQQTVETDLLKILSLVLVVL